jgi:hypothetical protein
MTKRKKAKAAKPEPKWKLVQRVVALLEKTISPGDEVLHDEWLTDVTTGDKRQFDVVIKSGKPPRQTITVVEVQKRGSRVSIGTFEGWVKKRESVGAHCLMCVSALEYPQSVKNKVAKNLGPSVRLLTLKELEGEQWRGWEIAFRIPSTRFPVGKAMEISILDSNECAATSGITFYVEGRSEPVSIAELIVAHMDYAGPTDLPGGEYEARVLINIGKQLYAERNGVRQVVNKLIIPTIFVIDEVRLPVVLSAYSQIDMNGAIAWVASAEGELKGKTIGFRLTFVPDSDGKFRISAQVSGTERGGYLTNIPPFDSLVKAAQSTS